MANPTLAELLDRLIALDITLCVNKAPEWYTIEDDCLIFDICTDDRQIQSDCVLGGLATVLRSQFRSRRLPLTIELTPDGLAFVTTCYDPTAYPLQPVKTSGEHEAIALLHALVVILEAQTATKEAA